MTVLVRVQTNLVQWSDAQGDGVRGGSALSADALGAELREFVARNLRSEEDVQVLLLLQRTPDRWWTPADVAEARDAGRVSSGRRLEELCARGLLDVRIGEDMNYRFAPANQALDLRVQELGKAYAAHRGALLDLIEAARPLGPVRDFADAFRLRKNEDHG